MLSLAAYAGMFVFGIAVALLGSILPLVSAQLHFDLARAGGLFLAMNCAILVTQLVLGPLMDRFGKKPPMLAGPVMVALALSMVAGAKDYATLAAAMAVLGIGGGMLNGATNTLVADLHTDPQRKTAALNLLGVFFGVGALVLPFTIGGLIERLGLARILFMTAALCPLPAVLSLAPKFPPPRQSKHVPFSEIARFLKDPLVLAFAFLLFCQSGNEFVLGGYATSYLTGTLHASIPAASYLLAVYWVSMMLSRAVLSRVLLRVRPAAAVKVSALATTLALVFLLAARGEGMALAALVVMGFSIAGIYPTVLGQAGAAFEEYSGTVFGILFAVALAGGMTVPWVVGQIAEAHGLRAGMALPVAGFVVIYGLQVAISRLSVRPCAS